jgi:toxin HigB-1
MRKLLRRLTPVSIYVLIVIAIPKAVIAQNIGYSISDHGCLSLMSSGEQDLTIGYSRIQAQGRVANFGLPAGMAIYSLRQNGTLISEASVQAAPLIDNNGNPFADGHTRDLYVQGKSKRFPPGITRRALRKLEYLDLATGLDDLKVPPSNRLHELERERSGQFSISVNDQWRICFRFADGDAFDVELTDYH